MLATHGKVLESGSRSKAIIRHRGWGLGSVPSGDAGSVVAVWGIIDSASIKKKLNSSFLFVQETRLSTDNAIRASVTEKKPLSGADSAVVKA